MNPNPRPATYEAAVTRIDQPSYPVVPTRLMPPAELPPGVALVTLPDGTQHLGYTQPAAALPATYAPAGAQPIPAWAKTTALLAPTVGGGVAVGALGLSAAAPGLLAMTSALWAACALIITSGIAAAVLIGAGRSKLRAVTQQPEPPVHITQNISAPGLFGRANGTVNYNR